jgi:hypothetical protein
LGGATRGGPNYAHQRSGHKEKAKEAFIIRVKKTQTRLAKGRRLTPPRHGADPKAEGSAKDPERNHGTPDVYKTS